MIEVKKLPLFRILLPMQQSLSQIDSQPSTKLIPVGLNQFTAGQFQPLFPLFNMSRNF